MEMKVIRKRPGCKPELADLENRLEALQEAVGGHIETLGFTTDTCLICNAEGRLLGLAPNYFLGSFFAGTVLLVGVDGDEFCDLPDAEKVLHFFGGRYDS